MLNRSAARLVECRRAEDVGELLRSRRPHLILLDLSGGTVAAEEATRSIRAQCDLPLIALVAASDERPRVAALAAGADDYALLPVGSSEMLARIRKALERSRALEGQALSHAFQALAFDVDLLARKVRLGGRTIHLTPTECKLLRVLIESQGKVVTHERLLREVGGQAAARRMQRLRTHMKQLRRKLELPPPGAVCLSTEPAVGYRLWVPRCV